MVVVWLGSLSINMSATHRVVALGRCAAVVAAVIIAGQSAVHLGDGVDDNPPNGFIRYMATWLHLRRMCVLLHLFSATHLLPRRRR